MSTTIHCAECGETLTAAETEREQEVPEEARLCDTCLEEFGLGELIAG